MSEIKLYVENTLAAHMNKLNQLLIENALKAAGWKQEGGFWVDKNGYFKLSNPSNALLNEYTRLLGRVIRAEAELEQHRTAGSVMFMLLAVAVAAAAVRAVMLYG